MGSTFRLDARLLTTTVLLLMGSTLSAQEAAPASSPAAPAKESDVITLDKFVAEEAVEDPNNATLKAPSASALGFARTLDETPRSVSSVSSQLIDRIGIRDADQLYQVVPGTFTVNRWGISGSTNIRAGSADVYLRGMKRIDPQGNVRNVITMWDNTEIVRGPPSPIFGNGRIGGYSNYTPKSARGTTGKYLDKPTGSATAIIGSFDRIETQVNYAQPVSIGNRQGGIQFFGQAADADSYYKLNFLRDRVAQGSFTLDLNKTWRLESGAIYQNAVNAGQAGANRVDQTTFNNNTYMRGTAIVNLDRDANGTVSEAEIQASRKASNYGITNGYDYKGPRPLVIFMQPVAGGINGVSANLKALVSANPTYAASAAGQAILAQPTATNIQLYNAPGNAALSPISQANGGKDIPVGFFLNTGLNNQPLYSARDWSLVAIEEKADADSYAGYFDLVADTHPDYTLKNQILYDYQQQYKQSQLPFNQRQLISVIEDKATFTAKKEAIPFTEKLPEWVGLEWLASTNARFTDAKIKSTSGDYDSRRDLMTGYLPTDTFTSFIIAGDDSYLTGEPYSANNFSRYFETGVGTQADLTFFKRLGILGGLRYDKVSAAGGDRARYNRAVAPNATATTPLPFQADRTANNSDDALSRSLSFSYKTNVLGFTPYFTRAKASAALTGSAQTIPFTNIQAGDILSAANLKEYGFKGSVMDGKLYYALAQFEQTRNGNVLTEGDTNTVRSTKAEGTEIELRYVPNKHWTFMTTASFIEVTRIGMIPGTYRSATVTAEYLGFKDVKDADGNVLYPANANLWGGNPALIIDNGDPKYWKVGQYPDSIYTAFVGYNWDNGFDASVNVSYVSENQASYDVPDLLTLPSYTLTNVSVGWKNKNWRVAVNIRNALDEEYWTPNQGAAGGTLLQAGIPRNYELSVTRNF
jgi:iron complex outermembrane receptor protein